MRTKSPVNTGVKPDPAKFVRAISRGMDTREAKVFAGYSPNTATGNITRTKQAIQAKQTIEEQREQIQQANGTSLIDCVESAQVLRDRAETPPTVRASSNSQIINIGGYNAPTKIQAEVHSQSINFHASSNEELQRLVDSL